VSAVGVAAAERAAPAVAIWGVCCSVTWAGCQPRAAIWRLPPPPSNHSAGSAAAAAAAQSEQEVKFPRASAALERCLAGAARRAAAVLLMVPESESGSGTGGRLLVLTHDHAAFSTTTRLFVTAAGEPGTETANKNDEAVVAAVGADEDAPCPICLEAPGAGSGADSANDNAAAAALNTDDATAAATDAINADDIAVNLAAFDIAPAPAGVVSSAAANNVNVLRVPCCSRAFCRGCLRDYLLAFPHGRPSCITPRSLLISTRAVPPLKSLASILVIYAYYPCCSSHLALLVGIDALRACNIFMNRER